MLDSLRGKLIVSCQPVVGGPMDSTEFVTAFAMAAIAGGAAALRIEGVESVAAVRRSTERPIIGLVKKDIASTAIRITPSREDVDHLAAAGADIIAFDATARPRPVSVADLIATVHAAGKLAMADCATYEDGVLALEAAADLVATTMSGYTGGRTPDGPDLNLVSRLRSITRYVVAEGRYHRPDQAVAAIEHGAFAVVAGSAITRPEHITEWFVAAIEGQAAATGEARHALP